MQQSVGWGDLHPLQRTHPLLVPHPCLFFPAILFAPGRLPFKPCSKFGGQRVQMYCCWRPLQHSIVVQATNQNVQEVTAKSSGLLVSVTHHRATLLPAFS